MKTSERIRSMEFHERTRRASRAGFQPRDVRWVKKRRRWTGFQRKEKHVAVARTVAIFRHGRSQIAPWSYPRRSRSDFVQTLVAVARVVRSGRAILNFPQRSAVSGIKYKSASLHGVSPWNVYCLPRHRAPYPIHRSPTLALSRGGGGRGGGTDVRSIVSRMLIFKPTFFALLEPLISRWSGITLLSIELSHQSRKL